LPSPSPTQVPSLMPSPLPSFAPTPYPDILTIPDAHVINALKVSSRLCFSFVFERVESNALSCVC
jgi:hypothetical protein